MAERTTIPTPWTLLLRRARYQVVPIASMVVCSALAVWLWNRSMTAATTTGEVSAVRVSLESNFPALLEELPNPVKVFDTVKSGQIVARLDVSAAEAELQRLQHDLDRLRPQPSTAAAATTATPATAELETRIIGLRRRIDARDIKSPINGTVMAIFKRPGESAVLGKPILTIAADRGEFIVGYLREGQTARAAPGMQVTIRARGRGAQTLTSYVQSVAPQVEPLPERHLRKLAVPEWALPVQVAMPPETDLRPGEVVDLIFHPKPD